MAQDGGLHDSTHLMWLTIFPFVSFMKGGIKIF